MNRLVHVDVLHVLCHRVVHRLRIHRFERICLHQDVIGLTVLEVHLAT